MGLDCSAAGGYESIRPIEKRESRLRTSVCKSQQDLEKEFIKLRDELKKTGMLWISWPKKSSGVATDLNENIIRDFGLTNGMVDVKVCAVDETWSGLKFMFRIKDR
ncbi:MAG: hypothetical protein AB7O48_06275 [Cyclobacteriaceae bacterium]